MGRARNRGRSVRGKPPSREMGGNGPPEPSDRQKTEENRIDKPASRRRGPARRSSDDRRKTVRQHKGYDQASLFSGGSDEKIVSSDDPSAVLLENKTAYISQILAPLTVLMVPISYKKSRCKHSKVPACPMNRSTTGRSTTYAFMPDRLKHA
jgi:hypothetical protein